MKKMVARLPGQIIICHHFGMPPHLPPPTPTLLDIPPRPSSFPIRRSNSNFYKFEVFACGGATVIPNMLKGFKNNMTLANKMKLLWQLHKQRTF